MESGAELVDMAGLPEGRAEKEGMAGLEIGTDLFAGLQTKPI